MNDEKIDVVDEKVHEYNKAIFEIVRDLHTACSQFINIPTDGLTDVGRALRNRCRVIEDTNDGILSEIAIAVSSGGRLLFNMYDLPKEYTTLRELAAYLTDLLERMDRLGGSPLRMLEAILYDPLPNMDETDLESLYWGLKYIQLAYMTINPYPYNPELHMQVLRRVSQYPSTLMDRNVLREISSFIPRTRSLTRRPSQEIRHTPPLRERRYTEGDLPIYRNPQRRKRSPSL